jgi:hypothetical protein
VFIIWLIGPDGRYQRVMYKFLPSWKWCYARILYRLSSTKMTASPKTLVLGGTRLLTDFQGSQELLLLTLN